MPWNTSSRTTLILIEYTAFVAKSICTCHLFTPLKMTTTTTRKIMWTNSLSHSSRTCFMVTLIAGLIFIKYVIHNRKIEYNYSKNLKIKPPVVFCFPLQHLLILEYEIFNILDASFCDLNSFILFISISY